MEKIEYFSYKNYQNNNEYKIIQLFQKTFKRKFNLKKWNWIFKKNPNGKSKIKLVFFKNKLIGQCASVKIFFKLNSNKRIFYRIQHFFVDKNYRLKKIATKNLKLLTLSIKKNNNYIITFPNDNSIKTFLRVGFKRSYIYTYEMLLKQKYKIEKRLFTKNSTKVKFDKKDINLINDCLKQYPVFNIRTIKYLNWRYNSNFNNYKISRIFFNKEMIGLVVAKFYVNDKSICICELFLKNANRNLYSLIKSIMFNFKIHKPKKIKIWSRPYFHFHRSLLKFGFKKTNFRTNVCVDKNLSKNKFTKKMYLSMGDSDVY